MKPLMECGNCQAEYAEPQNQRGCPFCGASEAVRIGDAVEGLRGKLLYLECEDLDDMIEATEARLNHLKNLRNKGFEVANPEGLRDDYADLHRYDE